MFSTNNLEPLKLPYPYQQMRCTNVGRKKPKIYNKDYDNQRNQYLYYKIIRRSCQRANHFFINIKKMATTKPPKIKLKMQQKIRAWLLTVRRWRHFKHDLFVSRVLSFVPVVIETARSVQIYTRTCMWLHNKILQ